MDQREYVETIAAHERVREASRTKGRVSIQPVLPVDILGAYVLVPMPPQ